MQGSGSCFQYHILTLVSMFSNELEWFRKKIRQNYPWLTYFRSFREMFGQFRSFWVNKDDEMSTKDRKKLWISYQGLFWMLFWLDFVIMYMVHFEHQNSAYDFPICYHLQTDVFACANLVQMRNLLIQNHRHDFRNAVAQQGDASVHRVYPFGLNQNHAEAGEELFWIALINI